MMHVFRVEKKNKKSIKPRKPEKNNKKTKSWKNPIKSINILKKPTGSVLVL